MKRSKSFLKTIKAFNFMHVIGLVASAFILLKFIIFTVNAALQGWFNPM
ncbi:hypothetical protein [Zunongwangia mangrovi]|nr:hypothetical protein [Zunongwangia mangrovi]